MSRRSVRLRAGHRCPSRAWPCRAPRRLNAYLPAGVSLAVRSAGLAGARPSVLPSSHCCAGHWPSRGGCRIGGFSWRGWCWPWPHWPSRGCAAGGSCRPSPCSRLWSWWQHGVPGVGARQPGGRAPGGLFRPHQDVHGGVVGGGGLLQGSRARGHGVPRRRSEACEVEVPGGCVEVGGVRREHGARPSGPMRCGKGGAVGEDRTRAVDRLLVAHHHACRNRPRTVRGSRRAVLRGVPVRVGISVIPPRDPPRASSGRGTRRTAARRFRRPS